MNNLYKEKNAYLQLSFSWIFAIIVGVVILVLAIFGVSKFIDTEKQESDVKNSKSFENSLNQLETGFESAKSVQVSFSLESIVENNCYDSGSFGEQGIKVSQKSFGKTDSNSLELISYERYIFSHDDVSGKNFYLFSKPYEFPFKVGDLIYLTPEKRTYCFNNPPKDIEEEIELLNQSNLKINDCSDSDIEICFSGNCEIEVNYAQGYLDKNNERIYFSDDALMYAGIFSDKKVYECQLKRLMKRTSKLVDIYQDKNDLISGKCSNEIDLDLDMFNNYLKNFESSEEIIQGNLIAEDLDEKNENNWRCKLW